MNIQSSAFKNNKNIPIEYTCKGEGKIIPIEISDVPEDAESLALIVKDPDAPNGEFIHWLVWNIDPDTELIDGNIPDAREGHTSLGKPGWVPPCPPSGMHHYIFTLYALDTMLSLPVSSTINDLEDAIDGHILDQANVTGLFGNE